MKCLKHTLNYYLDKYETLTPSDELMRDISTSEWWSYTKELFDSLIWQYFADRTVLINSKFDPEDEEKTVENILKSFAINLRSKNYTYSKLFETIMLEYNPLYNVDAFEFEDRTLDQTGNETTGYKGTEATTRSGSEKDAKNGTEATTRSGSEKDAKNGTEVTTRSGSEKDAKTGTEATTRSGSEEELNQTTTYDSAAFYDTTKKITTPTNLKDETSFQNREDTHTYNNVKDETSFQNREDTHTYNNVKDEKSFTNREDEHIRDLNDTEHIERRRYGNIGVTKSTDLIDAQRETVLFDFYKKVVRDCVNLVTYMIY